MKRKGSFQMKEEESRKAAEQKRIADIEDLNDYSKTYHHSNPNCLEEPIVSSELQGYCKASWSCA